jgi:hypothetical protein
MKGKVTYRKLSTGNYTGRYGKYYVFLQRRKYGNWWSATITYNKEWFASESYLGSSLKTLQKAKQWVIKKLFV